MGWGCPIISGGSCPIVPKEHSKEQPRGKALLSRSSLLYIIISLLLWTFVEYVTVWNSRMAEWRSLMPGIFLQYLFIIMIFSCAFYSLKWDTKKVFILMLVVMYIFEALWQNFLLLNPVAFLPVSFLLIQLWGFLTFIPHWLIEGKIQENQWLALLFCLWPVTGFIMAVALG
jgi:hypothetical protein